ncbi:MAG TPA: hypothetical protein VFV73_29230 [Streptosporangiaceae bacterium]|nr:hypothetical protein [Streptosporangiaceae bacterium]
MPSRANRRPARSLARMARWLGFDRNPLRRGTDRVEAVLRLILIILLVAVIPAAVAAGRWADHQALHRAQLERATDRLVTAVLLENAPASGIPDPYTSVQTAWVRARWQPPDQPPRTGDVLAVVGARQGSTVRTWIDRSGAVTDPPMDHRVIVGCVFLAVTATCQLSWLVLLAAAVLVRRVLDRRRLNAWEAEWRASGPLWSGHRS